MSKYTIGLDFGALSGRAVLYDVENGNTIEASTYDYRHSLMQKFLPDGTKVPYKFSLQHPQDYIDTMVITIKDITENISVDDIIGIGIDFSASTTLPVNSEGTPMCFFTDFQSEPNAYAKSWNHHSSKKYAIKMTELAQKKYPDIINRYGGSIASAWLFPKLWELIEQAPDLYEEMSYYIEAGDWIVWQLTGKQVRSTAFAGFKGMWNSKDGYPSKDFLNELNPKLAEAVETKLNAPIKPIYSLAGKLTKATAKMLGLKAGTCVAIANADNQAVIPAVKAIKNNQLVATMGTNVSYMINSNIEMFLNGISGVCKDSLLPNKYGYIAGPNPLGENFAWFMTNAIPPDYHQEAKSQNRNLHSYLAQLMMKLKPGESGIIAFDWFKGNRAIRSDFDLSAMFFGITSNTKTEEIYRALIESSCFSAKKVIELLRENHFEIDEMYCVGALPEKNPFIMQLYADILNMPIKISGCDQSPALGSAIIAAFVAGSKNGGYDSFEEACEKMGKIKDRIYTPITENVEIYETLYDIYCELYDILAIENNNVLHKLRKIGHEIKKTK